MNAANYHTWYNKKRIHFSFGFLRMETVILKIIGSLLLANLYMFGCL